MHLHRPILKQAIKSYLIYLLSFLVSRLLVLICHLKHCTNLKQKISSDLERKTRVHTLLFICIQQDAYGPCIQPPAN